MGYRRVFNYGNSLHDDLVEDLFLDLRPLQRRPLYHLIGVDGVGNVFGRLFLRHIPPQIFVNEPVRERDIESKFALCISNFEMI